ncbi:hypothetical protein Leryth_011858 [Lithospermum erythrorhizon]|nr:hypothetical protein Leryth_011858 [Lithospermum erythrorhizon]
MQHNHYNYHNIWHGLSAMVPFVSWYIKNGCQAVPDRWILYHWVGVGNLNLDSALEDDSSPVCFEDSVVMRHNEGGMGKLRRLEAYDIHRSEAGILATAKRSIQNESVVIKIFEKECQKVQGCQLTVAYSKSENNRYPVAFGDWKTPVQADQRQASIQSLGYQSQLR